jgi:hypothetical protein
MGKMEIQPHEFLVSALDGCEWSPSFLGCITKHDQTKCTNITHTEVGDNVNNKTKHIMNEQPE